MDRVVDFFAGSGLVSLGLQEWFKTIWANDIDHNKGNIFNHNIRECPLTLGDISLIKPSLVPSAELYWASFPCQDLSLAGNYKGLAGKRSSLVNEFIRIIAGKKPTNRPNVIALENVYGLISSNNGMDYTYIHNQLQKLGYNSGGFVLNALHWLPQSRVRVFIVAIKKNIDVSSISTPLPLWCHPEILVNLSKSLKNFIYWNLPEPRSTPKRIESLIDKNETIDIERSKRMIKLIPISHFEKMLDLLDLYPQMVFPGYKRTRSGVQQLELRFDSCAGCLRTAAGGSSKQIVVYKFNDDIVARYLTPREAARLMGVNDNFWLPQNNNHAYTAMGDAVAVPVTSYLAKNLLYPLSELTRVKDVITI